MKLTMQCQADKNRIIILYKKYHIRNMGKMIGTLEFNPVSKEQAYFGDKETPPLTVYK